MPDEANFLVEETQYSQPLAVEGIRTHSKETNRLDFSDVVVLEGWYVDEDVQLEVPQVGDDIDVMSFDLIHHRLIDFEREDLLCWKRVWKEHF